MPLSPGLAPEPAAGQAPWGPRDPEGAGSCPPCPGTCCLAPSDVLLRMHLYSRVPQSTRLGHQGRTPFSPGCEPVQRVVGVCSQQGVLSLGTSIPRPLPPSPAAKGRASSGHTTVPATKARALPLTAWRGRDEGVGAAARELLGAGAGAGRWEGLRPPRAWRTRGQWGTGLSPTLALAAGQGLSSAGPDLSWSIAPGLPASGGTRDGCPAGAEGRMVGGKAGGREPEARPALARGRSSPWGRLLVPKEQMSRGRGLC